MNYFRAVFSPHVLSRTSRFMALLVGSVLMLNRPCPAQVPTAYPDRFNVVWTTPSETSAGSMPLGNGDIGINVWVEPNGDVCLYIAKTDALDENNRLLKVGKLRLALDGATPTNFRQELRLRTGDILISSGAGRSVRTWRIWVDASHPLVHIEATGSQPASLTVRSEPWRTTARPFIGETTAGEIHSAYDLQQYKGEVLSRPDTVLAEPNHILWCHRNPNDAFSGKTLYEQSLRWQGLGDFYEPKNDILRNRTVGAAVWGDGLASAGPLELRSAKANRQYHVVIGLLTSQAPTLVDWQRDILKLSHSIDSQPFAGLRQTHEAHWRDFWNRSYVDISGPAQTDTVARGYVLQRFVSACGAGGILPAKFNGGLFTAQTPERQAGTPANRATGSGQLFDADYRRWGGCYWFQNTRHIYWPMLGAGEFADMKSLFRLYLDNLPLARARVRTYFGHDGAMYPETMTAWGAYAQSDYGWQDTPGAVGMPAYAGFVANPWLRYYYQGALELTLMMLDYYDYTQDSAYFQQKLLPFVDAILTFYAEHYADRDGKLWMYPAQSIENHWNVVNPTPDVAGLYAVTSRLAQLPASLATTEQRSRWQRLRDRLPNLPFGTWQGKPVVADAAQIFSQEIRNTENPALYTVYPYRLFTVGQPGLDTARNTYAARRFPGYIGWRQDEIQAALLGMPDEVQRGLTRRFAQLHPDTRFPAFWGPNFDWAPDQNHGNVGVMALQTALLQSVGSTLYVLPAWPKTWNVRFKLHAPGQTVVEGEYRDGKLLRLNVTPTSRQKDVVISGSPTERGPTERSPTERGPTERGPSKN